MAGNSFLLKGWAVTLIAGIFALSSNDTDKLYFLVAYIPILVFWALDSYYLCLSFRKNQKGQEWKLHEKCSYDFMRQSRGSSAAAG